MIDLSKALSYDKEDGITPLLSCCKGLLSAGSTAIFCKRPRLLAWGVFFLGTEFQWNDILIKEEIQ